MKMRVCFLICLVIFTCLGYSESQATGKCGNQMPCDDLQCIDRTNWCNGRADCRDESDEKYCKTAYFWSVNDCLSTKHFECGNYQCVPLVTKCDGFRDCKDDSDEDDCDNNGLGSLISEDNESENVQTDETDFFSSSFTETTVESTTTEENFPAMLQSSRTALPWMSSSSTTDFYDRRLIEDAVNPQRQSGRNHNDDQRSYPDSRYNYRQGTNQGSYPDRRYNHRQQTNQDSYPDRRYNHRQQTNQDSHPDRQYNHRQQTNQDSYQNRQYNHRQQTNHESSNRRDNQDRRIHETSHAQNRGSDTGPTDSFPSRSYGPQPPPNPYSTISPTAYDASRLPRIPSDRTRSHTSIPRDNVVHRRYLFSPIEDPLTIHDNRNAREHSTSGKRQKTELPPFQFQRNYTHDFLYYKDNVQRAEQWLFDQRNSSYEWGKDTPRALVAISLCTNSFSLKTPENDFMKKSLERHLGLKVLTEYNIDSVRRSGWKMHTKAIGLAKYINALVATCQDPRDFFGHDLVEILATAKNILTARRNVKVNPFVYITLCLTNGSITSDDIERLKDFLEQPLLDERSNDLYILATTALACFQQYDEYKRQLERTVKDAFDNLLTKQLDDGSFGSKYSTAIAAQALMSINTRRSWDPRRTMGFLIEKQLEDGSFGDMLATYYILPALSGRSLLHLRNTKCDPVPDEDKPWSPEDILNTPGPRIRIFYTLKIDNPPSASLPAYFSVPDGTSFFDIMRIAAYSDRKFKFGYNIHNDEVDVHTISNISNDPERGLYWHLFVFNETVEHKIDFSSPYIGDIRQLYPRDSQELVYWYLKF